MNLDAYTNEELIRYHRFSDNEDIRRLCDRLEWKKEELFEEIKDLKHEASQFEDELSDANWLIDQIAGIVANDGSDSQKIKDIEKILP